MNRFIFYFNQGLTQAEIVLSVIDTFRISVRHSRGDCQVYNFIIEDNIATLNTYDADGPFKKRKIFLW